MLVSNFYRDLSCCLLEGWKLYLWVVLTSCFYGLKYELWCIVLNKSWVIYLVLSKDIFFFPKKEKRNNDID